MLYKEDELISAFHKSLRSDNIPMACYWAKMISLQIGIWKVKQYMLLVCFEETLNINLYIELLSIFKDDNINEKEVLKLISAFVKSKKKWQYEVGQDFILKHCFINKALENDLQDNIKRYSIENPTLEFFDIHQWGLSLMHTSCYNSQKKHFKEIPIYDVEEYFYLLEKSFKRKDIDAAIYFAIYFYKNKDILPFETLELLFTNKNSKNLYQYMKKFNGKYCYVYNYVLLFLLEVMDIDDSILYEPLYYEKEEKIDYILYRIGLLISKNNYLQIPLTALDKHTGRGKDLINKEKIDYEKHLQFVDLRLSGSWFAIIWIIYAIKQYKTIDIEWEKVHIPKQYNFL